MLARCFSHCYAAQHSRNLIDSPRRIQHLNLAKRYTITRRLAHLPLRIGLRRVPARLDSLNVETFNGLGENRHRKACKTDTCKAESERAVHYPSPG